MARLSVASAARGLYEEVLRASDSALSWLRYVAIAVEKDNRLDEAPTASEIVDISQAHGINFPAKVIVPNPDQQAMYAGKLLNRLFRDNNGDQTLTIDRYAVTHDERKGVRPSDGQPFTRHYYWFSRR